MPSEQERRLNTDRSWIKSEKVIYFKDAHEFGFIHLFIYFLKFKNTLRSEVQVPSCSKPTGFSTALLRQSVAETDTSFV